MSKRKRINKYMRPGTNRMITGASMSEGFPSYIETEYIEVDITKKVKPYTASIILTVKQHGKVLGAVQMSRRP